MAVLGPLLVDDADGLVLAPAHAAALALLLVWARPRRSGRPVRFTRFYLRVWALFFLEYALVPLAVLPPDVREGCSPAGRADKHRPRRHNRARPVSTIPCR